MKIWQRFKNWLIKKLGGWTEEERSYIKSLYTKELQARTVVENRFAHQVRVSNDLHDKLVDAKETLVGLEILKTKIETFQAKGAFPYSGRSGKQLQYRIAEKKTAVVNKLVSDILQQNRFFVIEVNEESNVVEVSATISVLEGGVISGKEAQLPQDGAGAGDSRKSGETPQDD